MVSIIYCSTNRAWKGFRDKVGVPNKPHYIRYVELSNEIAKANGKYNILLNKQGMEGIQR